MIIPKVRGIVRRKNWNYGAFIYLPGEPDTGNTVRAYKGDKRLEDHPMTISVIGVSGNVLDELRTRLR